eukprot:3005133-Pleurochrysis_carterae.AAC.1
MKHASGTYAQMLGHHDKQNTRPLTGVEHKRLCCLSLRVGLDGISAHQESDAAPGACVGLLLFDDAAEDAEPFVYSGAAAFW